MRRHIYREYEFKTQDTSKQLTHWGGVTRICVSKQTFIGSDNGLSSPGRRQAIIWTNAWILLIGPLGTNFSEILIKIYIFSFRKMHLKNVVRKLAGICLGLNVLRKWVRVCMTCYDWYECQLDARTTDTVVFFNQCVVYSKWNHYIDAIMSAMASQITGISIVCSSVCSGADQRNLKSPVSLAFVRGIFPSQKASDAEMLPFDDVIMMKETRQL